MRAGSCERRKEALCVRSYEPSEPAAVWREAVLPLSCCALCCPPWLLCCHLTACYCHSPSPVAACCCQSAALLSLLCPCMSSVGVLDVLWRVSLVLTCPLCHHLLTRPSTLPCAHHVCRDCLHQYSSVSSVGGCTSVGGSVEVSGSVEGVCPVDGCRRPFWSRECQADNKQLHHIALAFTHMRDAILANRAADQPSHHHSHSWPNQTPTPPSSPHTRAEREPHQQTTKRTKGRRREQAHRQAHYRRGALEGRSEEPAADARHLGRATVAHYDDSDAVVQVECEGQDEGEGELLAGEQVELIGDSEVRVRMRRRVRGTTRQPLRQVAVSSSHTYDDTEGEADAQAVVDRQSRAVNDGRTERGEQSGRNDIDQSLDDKAQLADKGSDGGSPLPTSSSPSSSFSRSAYRSAPGTQSVLPPLLAARSSSARSIVLSSASRSHSRVAQSAVEKLGAAILVPPNNHERASSISHVVCCHTSTARLVKRTMKYMMGVLSGCWVVDWTWLTDSAAAGRWLAEDDYEIRGDSIAGATAAARRAREERERRETDLTRSSHIGHQPQPHQHPLSCAASQSSRCSLLADSYVSVLEPLSAQCPTLDDLTHLIQLAGGQLILPTINIANREDGGEAAVTDWVSTVQKQLPTHRRLIVLCRPSLLDAVESGECSPVSVLRPLCSLAGGVRLLSISWLLDSIGHFTRLPFDDSSATIHSLTHLIADDR